MMDTNTTPHDRPLPRIGQRREILIIVAAMVSIAFLGFVVGFATAGGLSGASTVAAQPEGFDVFWEVWNYVNSEFYFEKPTETERVYGAIEGMVATLDDAYTAFVEPSAAELERENREGAFGGIGAYIHQNQDGQMVIAYPFPGQPAAEAGLQAGDIVLAVDGQSVEGLTLSEGTALIRGPLGTWVTLEVFRPGTGETLELRAERVQIEVPTVFSEMLDGEIAYVALNRFIAVSTNQLENELRTLLAQNPRALIFDLRGNPGGLLDQAVSVSDLFLPQGLVATERTTLSQESHVFFSDTGDLAEDIPLVVLVDGGSASASEIVAGAIKDRERGVLVGTPTFGKGVVQLVHDLSDGSLLRITYGAWYTPEEIALNGVGIEPDILVEVSEDVSSDADPWLQAARDYIDQNYPGTR